MLDKNTVGYLKNAYSVALQSRDTSNQNGSVLVSAKGEIIGTGVNNFAIGVEFTRERAEIRPDKYRYFDHAERSSIYQAARAGSKVFGSTLYCPWAACCGCAIAIINTGVHTLVMHRERMNMTAERWKDDINEALSMLKEAGVILLYYQGPIHCCASVLVNGELWNPADAVAAPGEGNYYVGMETTNAS